MRSVRQDKWYRQARLNECINAAGGISELLREVAERERLKRTGRARTDRRIYRKDGSEVVFRSKWERDFAALLDQFDIEWEYEPFTCTVADGTRYTPDFLVRHPGGEGEVFVELHVMHAFKERYGASADKRRNACQAVLDQLGAPLVIIDEEMWRKLA